jgi:hypothetical protein
MALDELNNAALRELIDKEAIREVLARYCRGVDRVHTDLAKTAYFADASEDHGVYRGTGHGFIDRPEMKAPEKVIAHHCLGQTMIDLQGDRAFCETYFVCGIVWRSEGKPPFFADLRGRYLDTVERREAEWKIAQRVALLDITQQRPLEAEWDLAHFFIRGVRWPDDLVFSPHKLAARVD